MKQPMKQPHCHIPMPVKYWSFAGLMLTYWCNARCASCYLSCSPERSEAMTLDTALGLWRQLIDASPHGCRIHLSGGEPFGNWPLLIELCRRAHADGLAPLEKIETNAFWATDEETVRSRIEALDAAGMGKLSISADPYHQQDVPIDRCRLAARVARDVLGPERVQVRWRDWLVEGCDTGTMDDQARRELFARWAQSGRDRLGGRAADELAPYMQRKPTAAFADNSCRKQLLRSKHVHVDPAGRVMPGTCAGIILGVAGAKSVADVWQDLEADRDSRPIISTLACSGPVGLLDQARACGFVPQGHYVSKCHLCWGIRGHFVRRGMHSQVLGPGWLYGANPAGRCSVV